MGKVKGQSQFERFGKGVRLTRQESIFAKCYDCNGGRESSQDCGIPDCPLYPYSHYYQRANPVEASQSK